MSLKVRVPLPNRVRSVWALTVAKNATMGPLAEIEPAIGVIFSKTKVPEIFRKTTFFQKFPKFRPN
jgi:hypothetical protein